VASTLTAPDDREDLEPDPPSSTSEVASARDTRPHLPHVAAMDGLRGVAVAAVVVYHLNGELLPGGFLGVSLFFTLSGFLITNLLLSEWRSTRHVALTAFWGRRFRRLLPAASAGLALVVVTSWLWADASQLAALRGDVLSALAYVANWRFIFDGDLYGAGFEQPSPVLHYWSLAIEEQFYVVVALIALLLARFARRRRAWVITFGTLAVLSMTATVLLWGSSDTNRIYFGSDTRAFELLAGVLLALAIGFSVPRRAARFASRHVFVLVAAVAMVAAFLLADTRQLWLYRGGLWIVALGSVALILGALDDGPLARGLAWKPLAALGLISYGVYIFHWPVFVYLDADRTGLDGLPLAAIRVGITLALAIASYRFLEQPIRQRRLALRPLPVVAVLAVLTVGLLLATSVLDGRSASRGVVATPDVELAASAEVAPPTTATPTIVPPIERVLFLGDSLIHQSYTTLAARMQAVGIDTRVIGGRGEHLLTASHPWLAELSAALAAFDPDVVVLESCCGWGFAPIAEQLTSPDGAPLQPDTPESWQEWSRMAGALTDLVRSQGRVALWVLAPPALTNGYYGPIEGRIAVANDVYRGVVACRAGVGLVDWRTIAGPDGAFTWDLQDRSGRTVRVRSEDGLHFTPEGEALLADLTVDMVEAQWAAFGGRPQPASTCGA
jgi:peptidoglycan/LPS O-acetylase OafA/YrhL